MLSWAMYRIGLTTLYLNGTLPCVDFMDVIRDNVPYSGAELRGFRGGGGSGQEFGGGGVRVLEKASLWEFLY